MPTIADTLNDIQKLQTEMSSEGTHSKALTDSMLVDELTNFTTTYFFCLLAHTTLDALRQHIQSIHHPYVVKYYSMFSQPGLLQNLIRMDNISGTFILWNIFERHIDKVRAVLPGEPERTLEARYKTLLKDIGVDKRRYDTMIDEFNLIRLTRNSLHGGGIYRNNKTHTFVFKGKKYSLEPGKEVTPLRLMDVAETMWKHVVIVANGSGS